MRDYSSFGLRKQILDEIRGEENKARKRESLRRFEIYKGRIEDYLLDVMAKDTDPKDMEQMRIISSINLSNRITNKRASIYNRSPEREFSDLSEDDFDRLGKLYRRGKFNTMLKKANVLYDLEDQCILQVLPKDGKMMLKPLAPHHVDVVPKGDNPEKMEAVVLTAFNKNELFNKVEGSRNSPSPSGVDEGMRDNLNQIIADQDDYKAMENVAVWWTDTHHFITDKEGNLLDPQSLMRVSDASFDDYLNPIEELPFIDIAKDKDFEFWNRYGNGQTDFTLQFNIGLSDILEQMRLQGYSQPVISSINPPESIKVGPRKAIWLQKVKGQPAELQPTFEFASPSPDISGSMMALEKMLNAFLSSYGLSTNTVTTDSGADKYASGLERSLAMLEQFEASESDIELFKWVEMRVFYLVKKWLGVLDSEQLDEDLIGALPDGCELSVKFRGAEIKPSQEEKEASVQRRLDAGLMTKAEAIAELREVDLETARQLVQEINQEAIGGGLGFAGQG